MRALERFRCIDFVPYISRLVETENEMRARKETAHRWRLCIFSFTCIWNTGWSRVIGCLKLQVISRKRATSYRALLRKMTKKDVTFRQRATNYRALSRKGIFCGQWPVTIRHPMGLRHPVGERWGAGVETHFQEISWNLRPVVNGT